MKYDAKIGRQCRSADAFEASASHELSPEETLIDGERYAHMAAVVLGLPEKERLALILFKLKGLSHEEIAVRIDASRHSVPRYLARALAKCAAAMQAFEQAELNETGHDGRKGAKDRT